MAPLLESKLEFDPGPSTRRLRRDSMTLSIIPTNSLFAGDGIARWATRWLTVAAALRRPNENVVEALCVERSVERVRRHGASLGGWGPREGEPMEGRDWMVRRANANSPPTVMMKSRSPRRTCAPRT